MPCVAWVWENNLLTEAAHRSHREITWSRVSLWWQRGDLNSCFSDPWTILMLHIEPAVTERGRQRAGCVAQSPESQCWSRRKQVKTRVLSEKVGSHLPTLPLTASRIRANTSQFSGIIQLSLSLPPHPPPATLYHFLVKRSYKLLRLSLFMCTMQMSTFSALFLRNKQHDVCSKWQIN